MIFLAVYIPVAGGIAVAPRSSPWCTPRLRRAIILFNVLQAVGVIIGNVVYPRCGGSLNLDPVMVLLALAFWSASGADRRFLSTPLTMAMVIWRSRRQR
jgi:predicted PurR-regulated permease PerM